MSVQPPIPAAQYLRMSTDDQPNSIPTQRDAIQRYATAHGFEVVVTYIDSGKSGLEIRNRPGLRHLLGDVVTRGCRFRAVLVYDVSRWGRFQDTDESAHYEFLCRRAGIPVHYCAEQFENDNKFPNAIMKALKRTMAAEYSRELSIKIAAAHRRMAAEGYHVGGRAGYGLRRMLMSADGRKRVLQTGECKNLTSDHVVLVPGPKKEIECVRVIFDLAARKEYSARAIAQELNRRKLRYSNNQLWDYERVYRILRNEKFLGCSVWGMRNTRFHNAAQRVPHSDWIIKRGVFPSLISADQFATARQQIIRRTTKKKPDSYYLNGLTRALPRKGDTAETIMRKTLRRHQYGQHFGDILGAYKLIGYEPSSHVVNSRMAFSKIRRLKTDLFEQLKKLFPSRIRMVHRSGGRQYRVLEVDHHWRVAVYICRSYHTTVSGQPGWMLKLRAGEKDLPALICLPNRQLTRLREFYFVRDLGHVDVECTSIRSGHTWLAPENRVGSLRDFCRIATAALGHQPWISTASEVPSVIGDVVFTEDDPIINVDGNQIQLSRVDASILKLLLRNAGHVVSRQTLSHFPTKRYEERQLNAHIGKIRRALGHEYRHRITTVKNEGYMYRRPSNFAVKNDSEMCP